MRAVLLALACTLAACAEGPRSEPLATPLVDDFEDGNITTPWETAWKAVAEGSRVNADLDVLPGGFGASSYYLSVSGVRADDAGPGDLLGVRIDLTRSGGALSRTAGDVSVDASGFEGVAFALRGAPGTYIAQIGTGEAADGNFYNAYVTTDADWTEFRLPFSAFAQEQFGAQQAWTGRQVTHFAVYANITGALTFGLDEIRFY
jgi:hypothetical protein